MLSVKRGGERQNQRGRPIIALTAEGGEAGLDDGEGETVTKIKSQGVPVLLL